MTSRLGSTSSAPSIVTSKSYVAAAAAVTGVKVVWDTAQSWVEGLIGTAAVVATILGTTIGQISSIKNTTFARGTMGAGGGMSIVGEEGPERIKLPTGTQVFTNSQTRQMIGGANISIPVTINGGASPATVGLLKDELAIVAKRMEDAIRYGHLDLEKVGIQRA